MGGVTPDIEMVAAALRSIARDELLPRFAAVEGRVKQDGSVVTEVDVSMQRRLGELLAKWTPDIPLLGEEMSATSQQRLFESYRDGLWCLDPLDGTSNFVWGVPVFCVSLALLRRNGPELGIVYDPLRDECFSAVSGQGAWLNGVRLDSRPFDLPLAQCIAIIDTKRLGPRLCQVMQNPPYRSQRSFGSGALEWCWLAARRCQVYVHGRQQLWDYAAGLLLLREAGGHAETLDAQTEFATDIAPRSVIAAADPRLFAEVSAWLRSADPVA